MRAPGVRESGADSPGYDGGPRSFGPPPGLMDRADELRRQILDLVREYCAVAHAPAPFVPGTTKINYAGRVYDDREPTNLVESALDFWLTAGPYGQSFEKEMRKFFGAADFLL